MKTLFRKLTGGRNDPLRDLERRIGYRFKDRSWLEMALTHRSYRFENAGVDFDNQRLEFLGDAVLGLIAASSLYERFEDRDEGWLTSMRSQVTSGEALAGLGQTLELGAHLRFGKGEAQSGGRKRASNLADAVEAIIGAAYVDGGLRAAAKLFDTVFVPMVEGREGDIWAENPKGKLQEYTQRVFLAGPSYRVTGREGPAHATQFSVEVSVNGQLLGRGMGRTKQIAEKRAALNALRHLEADQSQADRT